MHRLTRCVRFSVNPFLERTVDGANPFASKPAGEGLAVFLELSVELAGRAEPATGLVVNVAEIDRQVRAAAVPLFCERLRRQFRSGRHTGLAVLAELLRRAWANLDGAFGAAELAGLRLKLNPFRTIGIETGDLQMLYFSEKFEFAATHKLWNESFSQQRNFEVFGKCANPSGHGHNYVVEVTAKTARPEDFRAGQFERTVEAELIRVLDHRNLNEDVAWFARTNPTVENIAVFAWERLAGKLEAGQLHGVAVWETDKTCCRYYG